MLVSYNIYIFSSAKRLNFSITQRQDFQKMRHLISKQTTLISEDVTLILLPSDIDFYWLRHYFLETLYIGYNLSHPPPIQYRTADQTAKHRTCGTIKVMHTMNSCGYMIIINKQNVDKKIKTKKIRLD